MTDLEILAQLKHSYELMEDIIDNADDCQIECKDNIIEIQDLLYTEYVNIYNKIDKENLLYIDNIYISDKIYFDYMEKDNYINHSDLNEKTWWEDDEFLNK